MKIFRLRSIVLTLSVLSCVSLFVLPVCLAALAPPATTISPNLPGLHILSKPAAPTNLEAHSDAVTTDEISISWTDISSNEKGFKVERKEANGIYELLATMGANSDSFDDDGLKQGTCYYYRVSAYNDLGDSGYSNEAWAVTRSEAPVPPTSLEAEIQGTGSIKLIWNDAQKETGYTLYRYSTGVGKIEIAKLPADSTTYLDKYDLKTDVKYVYTLTATNLHGEASAECSISIGGAPPSQVKNFGIRPVDYDNHKVQLIWIDTSDNEDGFWIMRKQPDGTYSGSKIEVKPNVTSYIDEGLSPETTYTYVMTSHRTNFTEHVVEASGSTAPAEPSDVTATVVSPGTVKLTWLNQSKVAQGFRIERKTGNNDWYDIAGQVKADTTSFTDTLKANGTYSYRITAWNICYWSTYTPAVTVQVNDVPTINLNDQLKPLKAAQTAIKLNVGQINYFVNNEQRTMDVAPFSKDGRTFLPISYISEALGASLNYNPAEQKVTIVLKGKTIELWVGRNKALVDGVEKPIDANNASVTPLVIPPGRTMLPLRFVTENLGCTVDWNPDRQEAIVYYQQ